jgi:ubiquinone/menaquinone biosynthesis C-methylase UbiE
MPQHASLTNSTSVQKYPKAEYVLATGERAVRRLLMLHDIYSPAGRRVLLRAGLKPGMRVADFGCGIGATTRTLAEMVGPTGSVTGIDASEAQLVQTGNFCCNEGLTNVSLWKADACDTGLADGTFDVVYCRFLLIHLPDPVACLREMRRVLKPGGTIVVEDGDLSSAGSLPASALDEFGDLFTRLGPKKGVDYLLGRHLFHLVKRTGFFDVDIEIHQPACARGENRAFLKWSIEEAGQGCVDAGLLSREHLNRTLKEMQTAVDDPNVLVLMPRMSLVWARKGH